MGKETDAPGSYVRLGWLINQHFPGYVDAYFGSGRCWNITGKGKY